MADSKRVKMLEPNPKDNSGVIGLAGEPVPPLGDDPSGGAAAASQLPLAMDEVRRRCDEGISIGCDGGGFASKLTAMAGNAR